MSETKMIIVMRKDLNLRKGKMIAQGAHAVLGIFTRYLKAQGIDATIEGPIGKCAEEWAKNGSKKICVSVPSESDLMRIYGAALAKKLPVCLVTDAGLTELKEPTRTCLAIGPCYAEDVDPITGDLPLL